MMEQFGERLLCKPCRHNAETEAKAPKRPSYTSHLSADTIRNWGIVLTLVAVGLYLGVRMFAWSMIKKAGGDIVETTQSWAKKPVGQWPVLATSLSPGKNGAAMPEEWQLGPNACVIQRKDGSLVCASAVAERVTLALLTQPNENRKEPAPLEFEQFSKIAPNCDLKAGNDRVAFASLLPDAHGAFDQGIVCFDHPDAKLPKGWQPFQIRQNAYVGGMKMTVLVRDSRSGSQVSLEAMIASNNISGDLDALTSDRLHDLGRRTGDGSETLITLAKPYSSEALIGAPVVDVRGNLAAIITMAYSPVNTEGLTTDFVAYGMKALQAFTDPAAAPAKK